MLNILIFIGILLFLVVAHELGHFGVAKLAKVRVLEFGVGLPPKIWGFQRGDTVYSVNALPVGGFVRMLGEEDPTHAESFARQGAFTRLAVLFAGPGVNALLPVILLTIVFMLPRDIVLTNVVVRGVSEGSPAAMAGVQPGDVIREADGRSVDNDGDLRASIQRRLGADIAWVVERRGREIELLLSEARVKPPEGQGATGITLANGRVTVTGVTPGSTAAAAGLATGDLFLWAGGRPVLNGTEPGERLEQQLTPTEAVALALDESPGESVVIEVLRAGRIVELTFDAQAGGLTGYTDEVLPAESRTEPLWEAVPSGVQRMWDIIVLFRNQISLWVSGASSIQVSGPVGIARVTGEVADAGIGPLITLTALLSINLAIVNILPFPALDGGRMAFVLLELARGGRRLAPEMERRVHLVGFAVLMAFIVLVSINDIQLLIKGADPFG